MNPNQKNATTLFADSLAATDNRLIAFENLLRSISDAQLHLADTEGGWTVAQIVSHIHISGLLWIADLERMRHEPEMFMFREELGHDAVGAPPPSVEDAINRMASLRHALDVCIPALDPAIADKELEVTTLGKMTISQWMDPLMNHLIGHTRQAEAILRSRGALPVIPKESDADEHAQQEEPKVAEHSQQ